jgi:type IV secretory pathway ATPase VirB11/archaellum biosynthesis ATPase
MTPDYTRAPWSVTGSPESVAVPVAGRPPLPQPAPSAPSAPARSAQPLVDAADLSGENYLVVEELRDRVSTRLTAEDKNYAPGPRRELTKKLIRDEYGQWLLHQANHGRSAPADHVEDKIFAAVLAELDGLGRLAPLLARSDVEDIHFEGAEPTTLRLTSGDLVPGSPIAASDEELEQLLRAIGSRSGDGQTSREFSSANPILNVRLKGVTDLGARLQAAMDVLPRPSGVIRVHRFSDPSLEDLRSMNMIDTPMHAFLHYAILAGASPLVSGNPGVGKTTLLRALGNTVPYNSVVITVEDERELGLHLPRWDPDKRQVVKRHAVCRSFESRQPNAEGMGGFDMGDALHEALRMSPTWVAVGEVRGGYVTSLLEAATSGIASVMCTIHARSAVGIFKKVKINALRATPAPDAELVMASLSELDLVVHVHRDRDYHRYVSGIYELGEVGDSGKPALTPIFQEPRGGARAVAKGAGSLSDELRDRMEAAGFNAERWLDPTRSRPDWQAPPRRGEWVS